MDLLDRVRTTLRRYDMAGAGTRVLAAVSGGPDSVALVCILRALDEAGEISLAGLAHLNHQLRLDAVEDEDFCAQLARELQVPFESSTVDVRALAARDGLSIEAAAHVARHRFLRDTAARMGAERVALGHTLDDQAETVLLRLFRGAGLKGLAGMHPRNGVFIRPMLTVRRDALRQYLASANRQFRVDSTNDDRTIPRNRIRAELLPWLAREFNPRIAEVLAVEAELAREDWRFLDEAAQQLLRDTVRQDQAGWSFDARAMAGAPRAVARAALRLLMERVSGGRPIGLQQVERVLHLCGNPGGPIDLPGHRMERIDHTVVLTSSGLKKGRAAGRSEPAPRYAHRLRVPGETSVPEAFCAISASLAGNADGFERTLGGRGEVAVISRRACHGPLTVRNRRPGDRLAIRGLGHKKVQDLFVDRKVPREARDRVPIVVDRHDRIVWVAGHSIASEFQVTDPAQAVIILRLKVLGGSA